MHRLSPSQGTLYWAAIRSLLLLLVFAEIVYCSGTAIPNFCLNPRPKSSNEGCTTERKFFFQPNKLRCKPFPICEEDADNYDLQTGINYFKSMDDCKQACSKVVQCPTMEPISNGVLDNGTSQGLNDSITYSCVEGYALVGSATRTCQLNGTWSGSEPYCQEQCRTPGPVERAMFSPVQSYYSVGSSVTYTCDQGHVGGGERVCQLNGTWTEPNMTCQYVECPAVQAVTNGVVTEHSREYGSNVTYSCLAGYELIGPSVRECLANSSWSGNEPYCQVMCPAPTPSDNAVVSPQSDYYSIGSKVQYTCSVGYGGDAERQCQANGTWSGTQPICEALQIECPDPVPIQHGRVSAPDLSVGSKLMYFCDVNYTLVGNSTRMCAESGEWSGSKPACARVRLLYGSPEQDVTNSVLPLPSGEKQHHISCVTEPASYPGRVAPTWSVVGNKFPHGVSVRGSQLVFASVFTSGEQKGEYVCTSGDQRATVNVTVVSSTTNDSHKPPILEVPPDTFCAPQGSIAMFQCVFAGCPIPDVSWYHNGTLVQSDNKTEISDVPFLGLKLCSLKIEGVTTRDVGNYQCIGSNIKGNLSSKVVQLTMRHHGTSKRSVQTDTRQVKNHHCREGAVTVVGQLRRIIKKAAKNFPVYRIQVHKVLRGTEAILGERKRMTVLMPPTQNPALRLQQDTTYIITGINIDNKLLFVDHNSIQTHSNELEDLIQTC